MAWRGWSLGFLRPILRRVEAGHDDKVAVTIDDGPHPQTTPFILDALDRHRGKATFFVCGFRAEKHGDLIADMVARGHAVYAHGWDHTRLDNLADGKLGADLDRCEAVLSLFRPRPIPYLVRLPYNRGYRKLRTHLQLTRWNPACQIAHWLISTRDYSFYRQLAQAPDRRACVQRKIRDVLDGRSVQGSIILMHDYPINGEDDSTLKAELCMLSMECLLEQLTCRGLRSIALTPRP